MHPRFKHAGIAGMLAGIALAVEFTFFMTSGWSPEKFAAPEAALNLLENGGNHLLIAAGFGFIGLALTAIFIAGLASRLAEDAPTLASATLYFGLIGIAGHSLVPFGLWIGIPALLAMNVEIAVTGWTAFRLVLDSAHGIGGFFMGLSMFATGIAVIQGGMLPRLLGWVALFAGASTLLTLLAAHAAVAGMAFLPALILTMLFRVAAGNALRKSRET
jgi:hypothetical protein